MSSWADELRERRQSGFKSTSSVEDWRRQRGETSLRLRKAVRNLLLQEKRCVDDYDSDDDDDATTYTTAHDYCRYIMSEDPVTFAKGLRGVRELMAGHSVSVNIVMNTEGVLARIATLLWYDSNTDVQLNAAWALTRITAGKAEHTAAVMREGALAGLVRLLQSPHEVIVEQAIWCLGNIATDRIEFCNKIVEHVPLHNFIEVFKKYPSEDMWCISSWALSCMCNGVQLLPTQGTKDLLDVIVHLLNHKEPEISINAATALVQLTASSENIDLILQAGVCPIIVNCLHNRHTASVMLSCAIGNIAHSTDTHVDVLIASGVLPVLLELINDTTSINPVKKNVAWTASNIAAGTRAQVDALIDSGLAKALADIFPNVDNDVRLEILWTFNNAAQNGSPARVHDLVELGVVEHACSAIARKSLNTLNTGLQMLRVFLIVTGVSLGDVYPNPVAVRIEECGGLSTLEMLLNHEVNDIANNAQCIIMQYFPWTPESYIALLDDTGGFAFGR